MMSVNGQSWIISEDQGEQARQAQPTHDTIA